MEWNSPNQGKLRKALLKIYGGSDIQPLRLFILDNFDYPLDDIGGGTRDVWAGALIEKFVEKGWIDELYQTVCQMHSEHLAIIELQSKLRGTPLIEKQDIDAADLFDGLLIQDLETVKKSFLYAFSDLYGDFFARPNPSELSSLDKLQSFVESDSPKFAVQFAAQLGVELDESNLGSRSSLKRTVETWRDRIAQEHNVTPKAPASTPVERQGYLLVSLAESARRTGGNASVTIFSELHVTGEKEPVEFGAATVTCLLDEVATHLSDLIHQAETALSVYGCGRVTLELFLPCEHLDVNVADWDFFSKISKRERARSLGKQRSFVIRSLERAADKATQAEVKRKWQFLKGCVEKGDACDRFHPQETPLTIGDLEDKLKDKPGLKLIAELPRDRDECLDILDDVIASGVPIALWFSAVEGVTADQKRAEFDTLLQTCGCLTDFSHLASQWRSQRQNHPNQHLRMLCDCPDRWPAKPFYTDPLIAS